MHDVDREIQWQETFANSVGKGSPSTLHLINVMNLQMQVCVRGMEFLPPRPAGWILYQFNIIGLTRVARRGLEVSESKCS